VEISQKKLEAFRAWMLGRGRSEDTADLYIGNLKKCAADPKGPTHRLVAGSLAPNTRRTNLAALRAWADYTKDPEFRSELASLRLPPARRVNIKIPLETADWDRIVGHFQTCKLRRTDPRGLREVMLLVVTRGLRCGDVLRIRRTDVMKALHSGVLSYVGKGAKRIEIDAAPIRDQLEALAEIPGWDRVADVVAKPGKYRRNPARRIARKISQHAKTIGLTKIYPHRFRHTFAIHFLRELQNDPQALIKLQKFMDWESIATAARYVDAVDKKQLDELGARIVGGRFKKGPQ
jgi:integrase